MKVIDLNEAKANLEDYAQECRAISRDRRRIRGYRCSSWCIIIRDDDPGFFDTAPRD